MARVMLLSSLLLLLGILSSGSLMLVHGCGADGTTVIEGKEKKIHTTRIKKENIYEYHGYVKTATGFAGVILMNGDKRAWFSYDKCFVPNKVHRIVAHAKIEGSKTIMTLRTSECQKHCTMNSSSSNTNNFTVVARGSSSWFKRIDPSCDYERKLSSRSETEPCQEPPSISTTGGMPAPQSLQKSFPLWAIVAAVFIAVTIVGVVVVLGRWKYETSRNAEHPSLTEKDNSPHVVQNDVFENDQQELGENSPITDHSPHQMFDNNTQNGPWPGQGEAPYTVEGQQYESFSSYEHRHDQ